MGEDALVETLRADQSSHSSAAMTGSDDLAAALAHHQAGRLDQAEAHYRRALQQDRFNAAILHNLGLVLAARQDFAPAATLIGQAIALRGNVADFHSNLGNVLAALGRDAEAVASLERALKLNPRFADAAFNLAIVLAKLGRTAEAEASYRRAASLNPSFWPASLNLANLLEEQGRFAEARPLYEQAVVLAPDVAGVHYSFGRAVNRYGHNNDEAEAHYRRALALDPDYADAHVNLGLCLLLRGAFAEGWREWEWRHRTEDSQPRRFAGRDWHGENLTGKRLLVSAEQAVGDQILYASMIPELTGMGGSIIVECERRLVPLFKRSFPGVEIYAQQEPPAIPVAFDYEIPFASLGVYLRPDFPSFVGGPSPYLKADAARVAEIRARYRQLGDGPLIGISWRSQRPELGGAKSTTLLDWAPILRRHRAVFIDLQYGDTAAERATVERELGVKIHRDDTIDQMQDIDAFAAQVAALDRVISVSNTTVHVAGALAVSTWILVPRGKGLHWYWFGAGESPWYLSARLFRQSVRGDWSDVIAHMAHELNSQDELPS
jgi:tetratricopeptide (TPR) repeat protein